MYMIVIDKTYNIFYNLVNALFLYQKQIDSLEMVSHTEYKLFLLDIYFYIRHYEIILNL